MTPRPPAGRTEPDTRDVDDLLFAKNDNSVEMRLKSALFVLTTFHDEDAIRTAILDIQDALKLLKQIAAR